MDITKTRLFTLLVMLLPLAQIIGPGSEGSEIADSSGASSSTEPRASPLAPDSLVGFDGQTLGQVESGFDLELAHSNPVLRLPLDHKIGLSGELELRNLIDRFKLNKYKTSYEGTDYLAFPLTEGRYEDARLNAEGKWHILQVSQEHGPVYFMTSFIDGFEVCSVPVYCTPWGPMIVRIGQFEEWCPGPGEDHRLYLAELKYPISEDHRQELHARISATPPIADHLLLLLSKVRGTRIIEDEYQSHQQYILDLALSSEPEDYFLEIEIDMMSSLDFILSYPADPVTGAHEKVWLTNIIGGEYFKSRAQILAMDAELSSMMRSRDAELSSMMGSRDVDISAIEAFLNPIQDEGDFDKLNDRFKALTRHLTESEIEDLWDESDESDGEEKLKEDMRNRDRVLQGQMTLLKNRISLGRAHTGNYAPQSYGYDLSKPFLGQVLKYFVSQMDSTEEVVRALQKLDSLIGSDPTARMERIRIRLTGL